MGQVATKARFSRSTTPMTLAVVMLTKRRGSGFFKRHGLQPVGIQLDIRQLLVSRHIHDADEAVRGFGRAAAVHDVKILRRWIVHGRVRIDGQLGVAHQFIGIVVVDLEFRSFSIHNNYFFHLREGQHVVGPLGPGNGMDQLVCAHVNHIDDRFIA